MGVEVERYRRVKDRTTKLGGSLSFDALTRDAGGFLGHRQEAASTPARRLRGSLWAGADGQRGLRPPTNSAVASELCRMMSTPQARHSCLLQATAQRTGSALTLAGRRKWRPGGKRGWASDRYGSGEKSRMRRHDALDDYSIVGDICAQGRTRHLA